MGRRITRCDSYLQYDELTIMPGLIMPGLFLAGPMLMHSLQPTCGIKPNTIVAEGENEENDEGVETMEEVNKKEGSATGGATSIEGGGKSD